VRGEKHLPVRNAAFNGNPYPQELRSNDLFFQHIAIFVSNLDHAQEKHDKIGIERTF
jgi:hypothetical protein